VTGRWRIRQRLIFAVTLAAAAPSVAIAYWVVQWLREGVPLALAVTLVVGWTALVSLAAAVYGVVAARRLVGPLEALTKALRAFDPSLGDTGHPALVESVDEPSETADLKRALRGSVERIGRDRAQKEAVLAGLMHDLKTPLVAQQLLIGQLSVLDGDRRETALYQLQLSSVGAVVRLNRLIDVLRVDAIDGRVERREVEVRVLVDEVVDGLAPLIAARDVRLETAGAWTTSTDADRVARALENVVSNAVRHARRSVDVHVHPGLVTVTDDGPGFAAPFDELVDPFRPGPVTYDRPTGTAGLGLYIARRSLEALGGQLKLGGSRSGHTVVHLYLGTGAT